MIQYKQNKKSFKISFAILCLIAFTLTIFNYSYAQNTSKTLVDDIKSKIDQKNENIKQLEQEIQEIHSQPLLIHRQELS
jgi:cell division protein FtsL